MLDFAFPGVSEVTVKRLQAPRDLPDPGIEPGSPALQVDSLPLSHQGSPRNALLIHINGVY